MVIDEAQNLDASVLETVRLLSDFETPQAKLLQIILSGQPELADKLASSHLAQFRQRVSLLNYLVPLSAEESGRYIEHRLRVAGYFGEPLFAPQALKAIARFTEGVPRNINNCCFNALSLGFAIGQKVVDVAMVEEVIDDLDISRHVTEVAAAAPGRDVPSSDSKLASRSVSMSASSLNDSSLSDAKGVSKNVSKTAGGTGGTTSVTPANGSRPDALTPAEAMAYMQQLSLRLKGWKHNSSFAKDGSGSSPKPGLLD